MTEVNVMYPLELAEHAALGARLLGDHYMSLRMVNGRSMNRLAHRVASVIPE